MNHKAKAMCRGCKRVLIGNPYHLGGSAYIPETRERAKINHYGGYVCSRQCDVRVCVEMASSFPGAGSTTRPGCFAKKSIERNWGN